MNGSALGGIHPIVYAYFTAAGAIDARLMRRQVRACLAGGADGLACLGIATEVAKLTPEERLEVLELVAGEVAGQVPLAVTVFGATVAEQLAVIERAAAAGADWVILQPPAVSDLDEAALMRFFGAVADASPLPVGIQNAPQYLGVGLSPEGIVELAMLHPNLRLLKGEGSAVEIQSLIQATGGRLTVFNGRGGLKPPDDLRAGCAGLIPAPDCFDWQVRCVAAFRARREEEAEALYRHILPAITFVMQSIPALHCYGKRLTARRLGIAPADVHDRAPALAPSAFGLEVTERLAAKLGPLPDICA